MPADWDRIRAVKRRVERALLWKANVVGVAVGRKMVGGQPTEEPAIVVLVSHKLPEAQVPQGELIPHTLGGVTTDVVETGEFRALSQIQVLEKPRTARWRPAPGGVSVAHRSVGAGTLGCLVERGSDLFILSNNHVLADTNRGRPGDAILQPAPHDGGTKRDALAKLETYAPLLLEGGDPLRLPRTSKALGPVLKAVGLAVQVSTRRVANQVDAAIARPLDDDDVSNEILEIGRPKGTAEVDLGTRIAKSGRTTGYREGKVTHLDGTVKVSYGDRGEGLFTDQILAGPISEGGDSGAVVVDAEGRVVGLLFAGNDATTVINRIDLVLKALKVKLAT